MLRLQRPGRMDLFFDGLHQGRRNFFAVDAAFYEFTERLLLAQKLSVAFILLDFFQHFSFFFRGQLVIQQEVEALDKILIGLIVVHRKKYF